MSSLAIPTTASDSDLPVLYSYFRSSCSWRVRIALNLRKIKYEYRPINLLKSEHKTDEFRKISPFGFVPAYIDNKSGKTLIESISILEYLEEIYTESPLLPKEPAARAAVRTLVQAIATDIQPVANMRVLQYVGEEKKAEFAKHFIEEGFKAFEVLVQKTAGAFAFGESITMADVVIVPQVYNAVRFGVDMSLFPIISRLNRELSEIPEFQAAHPSCQIDCPDDLK
ncbi:Glutathione S-transferase zeta-1 [Modicella reniformis]|uniref:Glutathione S-transferase zeta-1 n=1 Tax=Modicella reniformis TaxID=1440133 RepID=A0A9P6J615_9FUNG|nr:Glutathione S-transferase zeta-1 [Modicella reniformis]